MHIKGDHAELVVGGRLDVRSAADARTSLHTALDGGQGDLVLDLGGLDSWDATGLGVIMGAHRRAGRCGRRLVLRSVPPQMQRLLVATRLHRILAIEGGSVEVAYDGGDGGEQAGGTYPGGAHPNGTYPSSTHPSSTHPSGTQVHGAYPGGAYPRGPYTGELYETEATLGGVYENRTYPSERYEHGTYPGAAYERQRVEHRARDDGGHEGGTLTKP